jgi:hypothetical protein
MSEESRRFTDREVALVLRKASEIEETDGAAAAGGLSLGELTDIAKEVGISADAIRQAVSGLDRRRSVGPALAGAPLVRKAVHAVPGELNKEAIALLIQMIDDRTDSAGTISEALGSVRWTSSDRFRSTRVSITPARGETSIEVVEKARPRMRRIFHLLPAAWSLMIAGSFIGAMQLPVAVAGLMVAAGAGIGRGAWSLVSAQGRRRVKRLAESLAEEAHDAAGRGQLADAPASEPDRQ